MRETKLRISLQRCQSRTRLARSALDDFQQVFIEAARPLPICTVAQLAGMHDGVRALLTCEEVDHGV
jgi:hypothetical protein